MAKQTLVLRIKENKNNIKNKILYNISRRLRRSHALVKASKKTAERVQVLFRNKMLTSNTYVALSTRSKLVGELGLENPKGKIDAIIETWVNSLRVDLKPTKSKALGIKGSFTISMVPSDYSDVLALREASQRATSTTGGGKTELLEWLNWLLIQGDRKIVLGYTVVLRSGAGRTGLAVMVRSRRGKSWGVPAEFAGTKNKNFVTEVLKKMIPAMEKIMVDELTKAIERI